MRVFSIPWESSQKEEVHICSFTSFETTVWHILNFILFSQTKNSKNWKITAKQSCPHGWANGTRHTNFRKSTVMKIRNNTWKLPEFNFDKNAIVVEVSAMLICSEDPQRLRMVKTGKLKIQRPICIWETSYQQFSNLGTNSKHYSVSQAAVLLLKSKLTKWDLSCNSHFPEVMTKGLIDLGHERAKCWEPLVLPNAKRKLIYQYHKRSYFTRPISNVTERLIKDGNNEEFHYRASVL